MIDLEVPIEALIAERENFILNPIMVSLMFDDQTGKFFYFDNKDAIEFLGNEIESRLAKEIAAGVEELGNYDGELS